ncbi:hypothetical protein DPMN_143788 [Dreissena polymorpha]|uniref:Uncharacterized protein n=1 Tax=Dreissena polymorpha TaxID=45954 RepID=A0A9D4GDG7_DREPO|nr:hypothetical protein DPMN_143788 [Dreissena polymorpha]
MKTAATLAAIQAINSTNLRTKFHEDWAINVTSRVSTSKAAPPTYGHIFQQTKTIFKLSLAIIKTNIQTKFHEDWTINVTPRVLTIKTTLPSGGHVFVPNGTIFKLNGRIQETNVLTKFHEDWTKNVTSKAFTCFHLTHIKKNAPPPGGHVLSLIWTIFELVRDISETNVLTMFHDDWAKIVTSRVFTRNTALPPGGHVFQWTEIIFELNQHIIKLNILTQFEHQIFELSRGIIGTNVLTKFHEDRTINVASRVFTRQNIEDERRTTDNGLWTKGDHKSSP